MKLTADRLAGCEIPLPGPQVATNGQGAATRFFRRLVGIELQLIRSAHALAAHVAVADEMSGQRASNPGPRERAMRPIRASWHALRRTAINVPQHADWRIRLDPSLAANGVYFMDRHGAAE